MKAYFIVAPSCSTQGFVIYGLLMLKDWSAFVIKVAAELFLRSLDDDSDIKRFAPGKDEWINFVSVMWSGYKMLSMWLSMFITIDTQNKPDGFGVILFGGAFTLADLMSGVIPLMSR